MARVLCVGMAVADFVFYVDAFPDRAEKYRARDAAIIGGGGAANAAVAIRRLGGQAVLSARLGTDPVAEVVLQGLAAQGVDCSAVVRRPHGRSGFSAVLVDGAGERQIINFRGEGQAETPRAAPEGLAAVLVDTRWPGGAIPALDHARARGLPGVVDAEDPIDPAILAAASHVAFSRQGLESLARGRDRDAALMALAGEFGVWAAVTDGAAGVWFTEGGGVVHEPAFPVAVVDTLGAGDVWHGAFALALARGRAERAAVRFASAAAALKCTRPGVAEGAPDADEVAAFLSGAGR